MTPVAETLDADIAVACLPEIATVPPRPFEPFACTTAPCKLTTP